MSAENTGQTPRITRREALHTILLGTVGFVAVSKFDVPGIDNPQTVTLTQTPTTEKPVESSQAAPAVVRRIPSPYERRLTYPKGDPTDATRFIQRYLNDWKHDIVSRHGAEVQMISTKGSKFEVLRGVKIRKTPIIDANDPDNLVTRRTFNPGVTGYYDSAIHVILPDRPQNGVWLPINYNSTTHHADFSVDSSTIPAVVAMEFNGEHLIKDINKNLHPEDLVEIPWH